MEAWSAEAAVFISLEQLKLHPIKVSRAYRPGELDYCAEDFRQAGPLKLDAVAELTGSEIRIRGRLSARLLATCDRCLAPVEVPLENDFDLFYRPMASIARNDEIEISPDELGVGFYSGDGIDLADVVTEQVNLAMPAKLVCKADCKGLCPVCGANLNVAPCQCRREQSEHASPFSSLLDNSGGRR